MPATKGSRRSSAELVQNPGAFTRTDSHVSNKRSAAFKGPVSRRWQTAVDVQQVRLTAVESRPLMAVELHEYDPIRTFAFFPEALYDFVERCFTH
jgi:hypothetical protein